MVTPPPAPTRPPPDPAHTEECATTPRSPAAPHQPDATAAPSTDGPDTYEQPPPSSATTAAPGHQRVHRCTTLRRPIIASDARLGHAVHTMAAAARATNPLHDLVLPIDPTPAHRMTGRTDVPQPPPPERIAVHTQHHTHLINRQQPWQNCKSRVSHRLATGQVWALFMIPSLSMWLSLGLPRLIEEGGLRDGRQGHSVSFGLAPLSLDPRPYDHKAAGHPGEAEEWGLPARPTLRARGSVVTRSAAEAAANAASPAVSQPMPANRHDPITSVLSASSSARSLSSPTRTDSLPYTWQSGSNVVSAGLPQPTEGGGVAPRLRREMAAESEHVGPPTPSPIRAILRCHVGCERPDRELAYEFLQPEQMGVAGSGRRRGQPQLWWRTSRHTRPPCAGEALARRGSGSACPCTGRTSTWAPNRSDRTTSAPSMGAAS